MKVVYVIEKNGVPMPWGGGYVVQTYQDPKFVEAWGQVTPIVRLKTERPVPYVSIETLQVIATSANPREALEALVGQLAAEIKHI